MNITFSRDINNNYLVISDAGAAADSVDFRTKMLLHNRIEGFMPLNIIYTDDIPSFSYNITGLKPLSVIFDGRKISYDELFSIVSGIKAMLGNAERYLLNFDSILFDEAHIYADPETLTPCFCYCPLCHASFDTSFKNLLCFFLNHIDHEDERCVLMAYAMQQASLREELSFIDVLNSVFKTNEQEVKESEPLSTVSTNYTPPAYDRPLIKPTINKEFEVQRISLALLLPALKPTLLLTTLLVICVLIQVLAKVFPLTIFIPVIIVLLALVSYNLGSLYSHKSDFYRTTIVSKTLEKRAADVEKISDAFSDTFSKTGKTSSKYDTFGNPTPDNYAQEDASEDFGKTVLLYSSNSTSYKLIYSGNEDFKDLPLQNFPYIVGKLSANANGIIASPLVSRIHARIVKEGDDIFLEDLNSTNGTYVNETILTPNSPFSINPGDKISFAKINYIFTAL